MTSKTAETSAPILSALADRWSPRAFTGEALSLDAITPALEAARWAPSANNSQPWRFYVASKSENPEGFAKLLAYLAPANAIWAQNASILMIAAYQSVTPEGRTLGWAQYDLGQAAFSFSAQARQDGLYVHQMGGFDAAAATLGLEMPEGWHAHTAIAVGKLASAEALPAPYNEREVAPRLRKALSELALAV